MTIVRNSVGCVSGWRVQRRTAGSFWCCVSSSGILFPLLEEEGRTLLGEAKATIEPTSRENNLRTKKIKKKFHGPC